MRRWRPREVKSFAQGSHSWGGTDLEFEHRSVCKEESKVVLEDVFPGHTSRLRWSRELNPETPLGSEGLVVSGSGVQITETGPLGVAVGSWDQRN